MPGSSPGMTPPLWLRAVEFRFKFSNSPRASTHIRTDVIHRPHYLFGHSAAKTRVNALLGPPSSSFPHTREGAERRKALGNIWHLGEGAACHVTGTLASRRSTVAIFHLGAVLPGRDRGLEAPRVTCGFRRRRSAPASSH